MKLGNNFSEKNSGKVVSEDGFDTIPLITPLDASQLQFPPPEKVRYLCFLAAAAKPTCFFMNTDSCVSKCRLPVSLRWL